MARYVMSHRTAGVVDPSSRAAIRANADHAFSTLFAASADLVGALRPEAETKREIIVFDADPTEVVVKRNELGPDVILEREILHYPAATSLTADATGGGSARPESAGTGESIRLTVAGPTGPLEGAEVHLTLRVAGQVNNLTGRTDPAGEVTFEFGPPWTPAVAVAVPAGNHWTMVLQGPTDGAVIDAPELPEEADGWWHRAVGANGAAGAGVTVGVADTGVGPHPHVQHVAATGAFVDGSHDSDPAASLDVDSHGTHVCGTIGARPTSGALRPAGVAAAADLVCARVFRDAESGANQGDIAAAVEHLATVREADLINLSLSSPAPSQISWDAIVAALEAGTLTICAAANAAGPVHYPAAYNESIAVSAVGLQGWGPPGSLASMRIPTEQAKFGRENLYLANFSCFGGQIDSTGPGVGIIAPVPERFGLSAPYGAMDGTSMASPVVCGALAAALSGSSQYLAMPRDLTRAAQARSVLEQACRDVGLGIQYQGRGMAQA